MRTNLLAVILLTTTYVLLRYAVFGGVSTIHLPVYLFNKSISMAAVGFLVLASLGHRAQDESRSKFWGAACWHSTCIHILLSLAILSKNYYPKFFGPEKMNLVGELTIVFGIIAAYCFWRLGNNGLDLNHRRGLLVLSTVFIGAHLVVMGYGGWLDVPSWHGGLPPVSMLSFAMVVYSLYAFVRIPVRGTKGQKVPIR